MPAHRQAPSSRQRERMINHTLPFCKHRETLMRGAGWSIMSGRA
jgi:hypothetical protein